MQGSHFRHSRRREHKPASDRAQRWLLNAYDTAMALLLFAAPLFMGGRHPVGRLVFVTLALGGACFWCARQAVAGAGSWRPSWAEAIVGAAVLFVTAQLTPLPREVYCWISPYTAEVLPLWSGDTRGGLQLGSWTTISLAPYETRTGLIVLLAYAAVFVTLSQRIATQADVERFVRWIAWAACGMAVLGLAQYLLGNGKFLWWYEHPFRDALGATKGPFANRNHFAHFLALGIGPLMWLAFRELSANRAEGRAARGFSHSPRLSGQTGLYLAGGMLLATTFAALLSHSRGGVLTLACVAAVCLTIMLWKRLLDRKAWLLIGGVGAIVAAGLAIHGLSRLTTRMESLASLADDRSAHMRLAIWQANWESVLKFPLAGVGAGAHTEVYPLFLDRYALVEFTHAENGYLQVLSESGLIGLGLLLALIGLATSWCWRALAARDSKHAALTAAVVASLIAPLLHGACDFVWWIPACMTPALFLLACVRRQAAGAANGRRERSRSAHREPLRWAWNLCAVAMAGLTVSGGIFLWGPARAAGAWERYLAMSLATKQFHANAQARGRMAQWGQLDGDSPEVVEGMARHLETALRFDPENPRYNARLASIRLRQFGIAQLHSDNPMALAMIRDAALASRFTSRQEQDQWLARVLAGKQALLTDALRHSMRAVRGSPLQGEVYAHLAELSFLRSPNEAHPAALISQALRARPHSGQVLLAAGREAALRGDHAGSLQLLRKAFHAEREVQKLVIELIAPRVSCDDFLATFQPDLQGLRLLRSHYRETQRSEALQQVAQSIAGSAAERAARAEGLAAAQLWLEASRAQRELNDSAAAVAAAQQAALTAPFEYEVREHLAHVHLDAGDFQAAQKEYRWCLTRRPGDERLLRHLAAAKRSELESGIRTIEQAALQGARR